MQAPLSERDLHTVLAALCFYQEQGRREPTNRSAWIEDLATNGGDVQALNACEIHRLCERLKPPSLWQIGT